MTISLKDYRPAEHGTVYLAAMYKVCKVEYVTADMWVITGSGLNQRSWCCHSTTPLFTSIPECEKYIEDLRSFDKHLCDKYGIK